MRGFKISHNTQYWPNCSLQGGGHGSAGQLQKSQNIFHSATPALQELSISIPEIELIGMKLCILNLRLQMDKIMGNLK